MNSFGRLFRVSVYGEAHGANVGVCIDGLKAGISYLPSELEEMLERRKPMHFASTKRIEEDEPKIVSGLFKGCTTGAPLNVLFDNKDQQSLSYSAYVDCPRPGHADFVANEKYHGYQDFRGGGHFSGRLTLGLVVGGYFAKKMIPYKITSSIVQIGEIKPTNQEMLDAYLKKVKEANDSVGGIIEITVSDMEIGLGEPFFDSIESQISHILFAVPGVKGVEFGLGFRGINRLGSEFNDCIIDDKGKTKTNNNGGINGGISNGNNIVIRVFVKPTPSIFLGQNTFNFKTGEIEELHIDGRHDTCIALRVGVVLESAVAIALADLRLIKSIY